MAPAPAAVFQALQGWWYTHARFVLMLGSLYSIFVTAYDLGFLEETPLWMPAGNMIATGFVCSDAIIRCLILVHIRQHLPDFELRWCMLSPGLLLLYIIDFAGSLLWWIIFLSGHYSTRWRCFFFFFRLIRFLFISDLFRALFEIYRLRMVRVIRFLLYELYWCHLVACMFFLIAKNTPPGMTSWIRSRYEDFRVVGAGELYITSMYFASTTVFTVGYGEIHPDNPAEMCAFIFVTLVTTAVIAYLTGVFEVPRAVAGHPDPGEVVD